MKKNNKRSMGIHGKGTLTNPSTFTATTVRVYCTPGVEVAWTSTFFPSKSFNAPKRAMSFSPARFASHFNGEP